MTNRLDNRWCLFGQPRLTDPQVTALRELRKGKIYRDREGYRSGSILIKPSTIRSLERQLLVETAPSGGGGVAEISCRGNRILGLIDGAA